MEFGVFSTIDVRPDCGQTEVGATENFLTQCEYADELGYDSVWLAEQRFFPEYSCSPAPELLAAALSQRTRRIRIGFAVLLLPYHHPIHTAGKIATLDILTRGRVDFGLGRGVQRVEGEVLGVSMDDSREIFAEHLEVVLKAWTQEKFTHRGVHYPDIPETLRDARGHEISIIPKPVQKPYPPVWIAAVSSDTPDMIGKMGHGLLLSSHYGTFEDIEGCIKQYRAAFKQAGHSHKPRIGVLSELYVDTTQKQAQEVAEECYVWNAKYTGQIVAALGSKPVKSYEDYYKLAHLGGMPDDKMTFNGLQAVNSIIVGDADYCIDRLKAFEGLGVDLHISWTQSGGMPHQKVMDSMRLFSDKVIPALR